MANTQTAAQTAEMMEAAQEEMRRLIFEAPIAELAEHQGISIDEAVALRVEQNLAAAVTARRLIWPSLMGESPQAGLGASSRVAFAD